MNNENGKGTNPAHATNGNETIATSGSHQVNNGTSRVGASHTKYGEDDIIYSAATVSETGSTSRAC